jgi:hypothetical protein
MEKGSHLAIYAYCILATIIQLHDMVDEPRFKIFLPDHFTKKGSIDATVSLFEVKL